LDQLEAQLANEKQRTSNDDDDDHANENALVAAALGELKSRLASLGMDGDANNESSLASMLKGRQEDLSAVISKDLTKFGKTATTTTNGSSDNGGGDDDDISKEMGSLTLRGESKEGAVQIRRHRRRHGQGRRLKKRRPARPADGAGVVGATQLLK
jgi:hypothetical protein